MWAITIPLFLFTTGRNARQGVFGKRLATAGRTAWPWLTLVMVMCYLVIAVLAQLRLNVLATLF